KLRHFSCWIRAYGRPSGKLATFEVIRLRGSSAAQLPVQPTKIPAAVPGAGCNCPYLISPFTAFEERTQEQNAQNKMREPSSILRQGARHVCSQDDSRSNTGGGPAFDPMQKLLRE